MDIGNLAAEAIERLPVPFVALEVATGSGSDGDLQVVWANPAARDRFGVELVGARLDRDQPFGPMESVVRQAELGRVDRRLRVIERVITGDSLIHLRFTMVPVANGATVLVEDVTDEVHARAELAVMGSTLERVERWGNLGVWEVDLRAGTVYWSTQVYEILGVEEQCLTGFQEVVHPDDRAILDHVTRRLLEQPGPYRVTHRILRGTEVRTVEQHMQSVPDETGRPVRLLGTVIDVTATQELQQQVHHGQQLRTIGLLAGGIAHDLANALLAMRGHADLLLLRSDLDPEARQSLAAIARGGERATTLTRRFMALGRRDELRPVRINPHEVLDEALELVGPAVRNEVRLSVERPDAPSDVLVLADPGRLRQVILDLVFNARDAGASNVRLQVTEVVLDPSDPECAEGRVAPGRYGVIDVIDDGAGIDDATLGQIFEPFFTTKTASEGSGLGLANAQDFAHQSLGTILAASTPGAGSTMSILLPATVASERAQLRGRRPARRVLVGAASVDRGHQLAGALVGTGAQVACMVDLGAIVYSIKTEPIDVVVLDEAILPPASWPSALAGVPTVVVTARPGSHPNASRQVDVGDLATLPEIVTEMLARPHP